jgi:ketosteroid isomerase-like protein
MDPSMAQVWRRLRVTILGAVIGAIGTGAIACPQSVAATLTQPHRAKTQPERPQMPPQTPPRMRSPVELTENQVRSRLEGLLAAIKNQDIEAIVSFYAPNAAIRATVNLAGGSQIIRLDGRQQIRDLLELAYPQMRMTAVRYEDLVIEIAPDRSQAVVTCTLFQSAMARDQPLNSVANQRLVFRVIDQEILITEDISEERSRSFP